MIDARLALAAGLIIAIAFAHSWLGEVRVLQPLLASPLPTGGPLRSGFMRRTLRFAWHLTTIAWWGLAAIVAEASIGHLSETIALQTIAAIALITAVTIAIASRGRHLAWPVFAVVAGICFVVA